MAVLPFGRLVELTVLLMAVAALFVLYKHRNLLLLDPAFRCLLCVFGCLWLANLAALPDAVNLGKSGSHTLGYVRFALAASFVALCLRDYQSHQRLLGWVSALLLLWSADIYVQAAVGWDVLGYPAGQHRLNGLFGDGAPKFAIVTSLLLPLAIHHSFQCWHRVLAVSAVIIIAGAIWLAGTRSAWVSLVVVAMCYALIAWQRYQRRMLKPALATLMVGVLLIAGSYLVSERVSHRIDTIAAFAISDDRAALVENRNSLSHRFWIWQGAVNMISAHPVNGVGPRGFRYAFAAHADPNDPFVNQAEPVIATHSHHYLLELLAETGFVGLGLFFVGCVLLLRLFRRASASGRAAMAPYGLCLVAGLFPLNTHLAFFSSFWSQVMWWLIALFIAASAVTAHKEPAP